MAQPAYEIIRVFQGIWKLLKWVLWGMAIFLVFILTAEVHSMYLLASGIHPWLGYAFLAVVVLALWFLILMPIFRFLKVPVAIKPPPLPRRDQGLAPSHLVVHLEYVAKYLRGQRRNERMKEHLGKIDEALREIDTLVNTINKRGAIGLDQSLRDMEAFENDTVNAVLRPLDAAAEKVIHFESLGVGVATAVSFNGTMDAFIVLWRNVNMVAKIARIYYGRPGPRASLAILRDVGATALIANYLDNITDQVGGFLGNWVGGLAGVVAGPLLDGGANAVMTLRLGYLAKARCRSFQAWTDEHRRSVLLKSFSNAKEASKTVLTEMATRVTPVLGGILGGVGAVGQGIFKGAKETFKGAKDLFSGKWPGKEGKQEV